MLDTLWDVVESKRHAMAQNHWLPGFNFNVEEWFDGDQYETLADCVTLEMAHVVFEAAIAKKPAGRFMICNRTRGGEAAPGGRLVRAKFKAVAQTISLVILL